MPRGVPDCHKTFFSHFLSPFRSLSLYHFLPLFFPHSLLFLTIRFLFVHLEYHWCECFVFFWYIPTTLSSTPICLFLNCLCFFLFLSVCSFVRVFVRLSLVSLRVRSSRNDLSGLKFIVSNFHEDERGIHYLTYPKFKIGNCRAGFNALLIAVCW